MRPLAHHYCLYESLKNGALDLEDIARLNEMIDVIEENNARASATERSKGR